MLSTASWKSETAVKGSLNIDFVSISLDIIWWAQSFRHSVHVSWNHLASRRPVLNRLDGTRKYTLDCSGYCALNLFSELLKSDIALGYCACWSWLDTKLPVYPDLCYRFFHITRSVCIGGRDFLTFTVRIRLPALRSHVVWRTRLW